MSDGQKQQGEDGRNPGGKKLADCLRRLEAGDASALEPLITIACQSMEGMARRMLRKFPNVKRWAETGDVVQDASLALWKRLQKKKPPQDPRQYVGLCAIEVHSRLLDLARKFGGPQSFGSKHQTNHRPGADGRRSIIDDRGANDTGREELETWRVIWETVAKQPARAAQAFRLVHILPFTRLQAAEQLGVDRKTVDRDLALVTAAIDRAVKGQG